MASSNGEFRMPGAYQFESLPWTAPALGGTNVFLPPSSPAASTVIPDLDRSTSSLHGSMDNQETGNALAHLKRKRSEQDSRESTPLNDWASMSIETTAETAEAADPLLSIACQSHKQGGVNYLLGGEAGRFGMLGPSEVLEESMYSDIGYRRALGPVPKRMHGGQDSTAAPLEQWSVFQALGSVVGKVWDFCKGGAFRGFHAGGGVGYDWETNAPMTVHADEEKTYKAGEDDSERPPAEDKNQSDKRADTRRTTAELSGKSTQGRPDTQAGSQAESEAQRAREIPDTKLPRSGKRRQIRVAGEELGRNWVVVDSDRRAWRASSPRSPSRQSMPARSAIPRLSATRPRMLEAGGRRTSTPVSRLGVVSATAPSPTTSTSPRSSGKRWSNAGHASHASHIRISHAGSPRLTPREPASFASPRSSLAPESRPLSPQMPPRSSGGRPYSPVPMSAVTDGGPGNPFAREMTPGSRSRARGHSVAAMPPSPSPAPRKLGSAGGGIQKTPKSHRRSQSTAETLEASPRLTDEAKKLAARRHAAEKVTDAKMEAFNLRLQAMIRQGKEALGTSFEIEGDGELEEGWLDE